MLKNTFIHVPGIGAKTEKRLWNSGVLDWDKFKDPFPIELSRSKRDHFLACLRESSKHLQNGNPNYFEKLLPANLHWRMFPEWRHTTAYLDIETTGLDSWRNEITTIALYDGASVFCYVQGQNLEDFEKDIKKYKVIVTYNGKCFDVPFIESYFGTSLTHAHIDLRYVLASLGYKGGLKGCERQLGMKRQDLDDIDGYFAVLLWHDFKRNHDQHALETLLAYNIQDTVNLEALMVAAYNMKLRETPFFRTRQLPVPRRPNIPFEADRATIERITRETYSGLADY